jgi:hypothetical protein
MVGRDGRPRSSVLSVSFTLDRYGHLFPGSEEVLNDSLDALAQRGSLVHESAERARSCAKNPDSFAHVARTPEDIEEEVDDSQGGDRTLSGRCGTRTHDLSRVKARSARTLTSHRTRTTPSQARIRHETALAHSPAKEFRGTSRGTGSDDLWGPHP